MIWRGIANARTNVHSGLRLRENVMLDRIVAKSGHSRAPAGLSCKLRHPPFPLRSSNKVLADGEPSQVLRQRPSDNCEAAPLIDGLQPASDRLRTRTGVACETKIHD